MGDNNVRQTHPVSEFGTDGSRFSDSTLSPTSVMNDDESRVQVGRGTGETADQEDKTLDEEG